MDEFANLEEWFAAKSKGFAPFAAWQNWVEAPEHRNLLEAYQFGVLAGDIRAHRNGDQMSVALAGLAHLVQTRCDAGGYEVYRGLCLNGPLAAGSVHEERSMNGWSLYPSIALRLAMAQGSANMIVLRQRLPPGSPSLYLDDWEHEVLRPPFVATVERAVVGLVRFLGVSLLVSVVDLHSEARYAGPR
ncbi:hypothetical protein GEU84_007090 [Fertoebacter nigrum]|uniref:Uncharacterized protein n=1 Tax=Fertoeibacter niger TaxID=2656921 RepID=A0A8X8GZ85_9RHOB|nr:hypothetical protein [Fertoeibacter niger]NUB44141.1 hypothetical protein [Fertoeibacter niger]